jgi:hypothetical protein
MTLWERHLAAMASWLKPSPLYFAGNSDLRVQGFRKPTKAIAIVFGKLLYGRLVPAAIGFGQLLLS